MQKCALFIHSPPSHPISGHHNVWDIYHGNECSHVLLHIPLYIFSSESFSVYVLSGLYCSHEKTFSYPYCEFLRLFCMKGYDCAMSDSTNAHNFRKLSLKDVHYNTVAIYGAIGGLCWIDGQWD